MYNIDDIVNTVIHGDSHIELKKIPNESIDCIIIDPPYRYLKHKLDRPFDENLIFNEFYRVLKPNSFLVIFGIGSRLCRDIVMLEDIGFKCKEECVWVKQQPSNFMNNLLRRHESFYILSKGVKPFNKVYIDVFDKCYYSNNFDTLKRCYNSLKIAIETGKELDVIKYYLYKGIKSFKETFKKSVYGLDVVFSNGKKDNYRKLGDLLMLKNGAVLDTVFNINREHYNRQHGTQKPLELMSRIVKLVSNENDIILDCFAGSGSTLLGAIKNDRRYIGIEIDNEYYDACINRIKEKQGLFYGKDF